MWSLQGPDYSDYVVDYDYLDLDALTGTDDKFYYTDWDHAIYDDVVTDDKTGKRVKAAIDENAGNVTVNYDKEGFPSRPRPVHPHVNNVVAHTEAKPCNRDRCKLPDCLCGKTKIKGNKE